MKDKRIWKTLKLKIFKQKYKKITKSNEDFKWEKMQKDRIIANHKQHFENTIKIDNLIKMEIIKNTEDLLN